jgi:hypothetical protein
VVGSWFLGAWFLGVKIFLGFGIYFLGGWSKAKATTKAKAIILSLRPSGFAPAFGRAEHAFWRELFVGLKPHA